MALSHREPFSWSVPVAAPFPERLFDLLTSFVFVGSGEVCGACAQQKRARLEQVVLELEADHDAYRLEAGGIPTAAADAALSCHAAVLCFC